MRLYSQRCPDGAYSWWVAETKNGYYDKLWYTDRNKEGVFLWDFATNEETQLADATQFSLRGIKDTHGKISRWMKDENN